MTPDVPPIILTGITLRLKEGKSAYDLETRVIKAYMNNGIEATVQMQVNSSLDDAFKQMHRLHYALLNTKIPKE